MDAKQVYGSLKKYIDDTLSGVGALKGEKGDDGYTPIKGVDYFDGLNGTKGNDGVNGSDGIDGIDGISPLISVNTNTDTEYTLNITDANGTTTTPNLKGAKGADGSGGGTTTTEVTETGTVKTLDTSNYGGTKFSIKPTGNALVSNRNLIKWEFANSTPLVEGTPITVNGVTVTLGTDGKLSFSGTCTSTFFIKANIIEEIKLPPNALFKNVVFFSSSPNTVQYPPVYPCP